MFIQMLSFRNDFASDEHVLQSILSIHYSQLLGDHSSERINLFTIESQKWSENEAF